MTARSFALFFAAAALAGCAEPTVLRVVDGHEVEGRFVSDYAYALYGRAAYEEAQRGQAAGEAEPWAGRDALLALEAAASEDEDSAPLWTAIGSLRCRPPGPDLDGAESALARARGIDPESAPAHRETARCRLVAASTPRNAGKADALRAEALEEAERAMRLDPDDVAAAAIVAGILRDLGRPDEGRRLLRALTIRSPGSTDAWLALGAFARSIHDEALAEQAARKARELSPRLAAALEAEAPALAPLAELDDALRRDDLLAAHRHARRAHLTLAEVAARAAALGRPASARAQAELVLAADPADITARVALAVAADLAGDAAALTAALASIPPVPAALTAPSPLAALLFTELLSRRVDDAAARAWLAAQPAAAAPAARPGPGDALLAAVSARVRARLH